MDSKSKCAVNGCSNTTQNSKSRMVTFYSFPNRKWETQRKETWINFCKRKNKDGTVWQPNQSSVICSDHFVGNKKSNHPLNASYNPSIYTQKNSDAVKLPASTIIQGGALIEERKVFEIEERLKRTEDLLQRIQVWILLKFRNDADFTDADFATLDIPQNQKNCIMEETVESGVEPTISFITDDDCSESQTDPLDITPWSPACNDFETTTATATAPASSPSVVEVKEENLTSEVKLTESNFEKEKTDKDNKQGTPQFACSACKKSFSNIAHMKRHYVTRQHKMTLAVLKKSRIPQSKRTGQTKQETKTMTVVPTQDKNIISVVKDTTLPSSNSCDGHTFQPTNITDATQNLSSSLRETRLRTKSQYIPKYLKCEECNITFRRYAYYHHMRSKHGQIGHNCKICGKHFKRKDNMDHHLDSHLNVRKYKCEVCPKSYTLHGSLFQHRQTHHNKTKNRKRSSNPSMKTTCVECKKSFYKTYLQAHIRAVHRNEYAEICDVCGKAFKYKNILKHHKDSKHSDVPLFKCTECDCSFMNMWALRFHKEEHNPSRPKLKCEECNKEFKNTGTLRSHISVIHKNKKTYSCELCSKVFKKLSNLKQHLRTQIHGNAKLLQNH